MPRLKTPAAVILVLLTMLSASVAYFAIGAVDRVTEDEVRAAEYLASYQRPLLVYEGGFNLPISSNLTFVSADRGIILLDRVRHADAVVLSQQLDHAVILGGQSPLTITELVSLLQPDYAEVFSSGPTRVFMKRTLTTSGHSNAH